MCTYLYRRPDSKFPFIPFSFEDFIYVYIYMKFFVGIYTDAPIQFYPPPPFRSCTRRDSASMSRARSPSQTGIFIYICIYVCIGVYIYIYIHMCMHMFICVYYTYMYRVNPSGFRVAW